MSTEAKLSFLGVLFLWEFYTKRARLRSGGVVAYITKYSVTFFHIIALWGNSGSTLAFHSTVSYVLLT